MRPILFLRPPEFEDAQQTRIASALHGILLILAGALIVVSPLLIFAGGLAAFSRIFPALVILVVAGSLNRGGYPQAASLFLTISIIVALNYLLWAGLGIHDISVFGFALTLIIAGLLLERRYYLIICGLVIASANWTIYADMQGWIVSGFNQFSSPSDMVVASTLLITISLIVRMLADNLLNSLEKTRQITEAQASLILETRRQAEQLKILNQVSIAVASGLDLEKVLGELYQQIRSIVSIDSFYVSLIDRRLGLVTFPIFYSEGERVYIPREKLDAGSGLTAQVIRSGETLYLSDLARTEVQKEYDIILVGQGETRSYVGIPLHLHGEVIGVLSVQSQFPDAYTAGQIRILETISSQASVAIDNARLFYEITESLQREERLNAVARVISGTLDQQLILENVMQLLVELLNADSGTLSLLDPGGAHLSQVYDFNIPEAIRGKLLSKGEGLTWWVIENMRSIAVKEYNQAPYAIPELRDYGLHGSAFAPVLAGDECLGAIGVLSSDPMKTFIDRDLALLEAVGRLAGTAIQNARLFSALQQELAERRRVESALQHRDDMLEAMTYAAEKFLASPNWRQNMPEVIERLGQEANVSQVFVIRVDGEAPETAHLSLEFAWNKPGGLSTFAPNPHRDMNAFPNTFARWCEVMRQGRPFLGSTSPGSPNEFPPHEKEFFQKRGVASLISVPIFLGGYLWGAICFSDHAPGREWLDVEVDALIVASGLLGAAIQRQQADEALREREALYRRAISAAEAVPYYQDYSQKRYMFMGERIQDLCGYSAAEMTPGLWDSLILEAIPMGESSGLTSQEAAHRARAGQIPVWKCDYLIMARSGSTRWVADTSVEMKGTDGKSRGSIGILQDITERKLAEKALQESEERLRAIFENSPTGIALGTLDGMILAANPSFQKLFGYSAEELSQMRFKRLSHPDDAEAGMEELQQMVEGKYPYSHSEKRYLRKDGSLMWGRMTASMIRNEIGEPRFALLLVNDFTEQKLAVEALRQHDAVLEAIAYAAETFLKAPDWQAMIQEVLKRLGQGIGASHTYIYEAEWSASAGLLFSARYEWLTENGSPDVGDPRYEKAPAQTIGAPRWLEAMLEGEPYYGTRHTLPPEEVAIMEADEIQSFLDMPIQVGNEFWGFIGFENTLEERQWSEVEIDSLKVAAGVLGAAIQRQRTDQAIRQLNTELEQRVRERTAELESANRELESFAYSVSHDLRAPLRGIDGYSRLLKEDYARMLDAQGNAYLNGVLKAASHMAELIDDLLKLARVTRAEMHREVVGLSVLADQQIAELRQGEPDRQVEVAIQPGMLAYGDPNLIRLALSNLISNAWKFTSHASRPRIEIGSDRINERTVYFVRDNGVGFDMQYHDRLFAPFQRLHDANEFEGTGIGLATVQRVILRHSGQIWAEGQVGQGATFYFSLPGPATGD